jgi:hypothetical protein
MIIKSIHEADFTIKYAAQGGTRDTLASFMSGVVCGGSSPICIYIYIYIYIYNVMCVYIYIYTYILYYVCPVHADMSSNFHQIETS